MNRFRSTINVLAIATLMCAIASIAQAQASRTWVSGVGDDANPCSRTAPCKTFAGAISKTATAGEINVLDPGGFGAVTITKSMTIDGSGGSMAGIAASGVAGIIVNAPSTAVVTVRNLDIDGFGLGGGTLAAGTNGISILGAKAVHVEHCQIYGFATNAILDNRTTPGSPQLYVTDTIIRNNQQGITITGVSASATRAFVDHCQIHGNAGFGVAAINSNIVTVSNSTVNDNGGEGVKADTGAQANVVSCVINNNNVGVSGNGFSFLLADTSIFNNNTGIAGTITTFVNNNVRNNVGGNTLPAPVAQQ